MNTIQLSDHEKLVINKLERINDWTTQHQLKTSRQTLIKLVNAGLVSRKINKDHEPYVPESKSLYRIRK